MAPALTAAYDELIGAGRWSPLTDVGAAVVQGAAVTLGCVLPAGPPLVVWDDADAVSYTHLTLPTNREV